MNIVYPYTDLMKKPEMAYSSSLGTQGIYFFRFHFTEEKDYRQTPVVHCSAIDPKLSKKFDTFFRRYLADTKVPDLMSKLNVRLITFFSTTKKIV
jgi:hypothetical protein